MKDEESHQNYTSMSGICWHSCVTHPLPFPPTLASFSFLFLLSFIVCQFASLQGSACVAPLIIWQRFCPHLEKPVLPCSPNTSKLDHVITDVVWMPRSRGQKFTEDERTLAASTNPRVCSMCSVQSVRSIMCFAYCVMAVDVYTVAMRAWMYSCRQCLF